MNYVGKFDAALSADGLGTQHSHAYVQIDSPHAQVPADAIIVADAHLLFNADFKRSGVDLILSKDDHELVLHDYFKGEKRAPLASPDGAHLNGDLVNALTGHVQYSQAGGAPAAASQVIGHVTKLAGSATVVRNGVSVILHQGDNVEKGDVVQAGSDSTLGITFIDGTVFGLSSNARMVLNEMVYDPNGSNNSSLISLVAGTISFVAGETAKHGDMKIDTPVATMGIRGTAVLVEIDFTVPQGANQPDAKFQVLVEPDGTTGSYILFDKTTLQPIAVVNQAGQQVNINNGIVSTSASQLSPELQKLITDVFTQKFASTDTKSTTHFTDSINPNLITGPTIQTASGATATPVFLVTNPIGGSSPPTQNGSQGLFHISGAPTAVLLGLNGQPKTSFALDDIGLATIGGIVNFADINAGDAPTVKVNFSSFTYQNAQHQDVSANLTALQLAEIAAAAANIVVVPNPNNKNTGSATWTYAIPGVALDFLAPGQTLTLTYVAQVDNNFALNDEFTLLPFTVTITGVAAEVWIATTTPGSPPGGLWSDPSKWKSGHVPTATDDVIVMTDPLHGLTPSYPVTINAPAVAGSLTINDFGATAPVLINQSTLTIGSSLSMAADSVVQNFGMISVGGLAEILGTSQLTNAGKLSLAQGGDFTGQSKITNTVAGIIELVGGKLNVLVNVGNSGLVQVDSGATLDLNSAAIVGGTVTVNGTLNLQGMSSLQSGILTNTGQVNVSGNGNAFDGETVFNTWGIDVSGALLLDQGTTITNSGAGAIAIDIAGLLTLDGVSDGATIDGGTVTNTATLDLYGNGVLKNGSLGNSGQINVSGSGNALDKETVTNSSGIDVSGALTIDQASTVDNTNGTILVDSPGTLTLNAATLTAGTVTTSGAFDLENATINDSTLGGAGTIATAAGNTDSTLNGVTVNSGTKVTAAIGTLDLTGTITNNGEFDATSGIIDLENLILNGGTLGGAGTIATATGNTDSTLNGVTVNSGTKVTAAVGTLDLTGTITNNGEFDATSGIIDLENLILNGGTLGGAGTIATAAGNTDSTLNGVTVNSGTKVTAAVGTLDLTGTITNNGEFDATSGIIDLENLILNGGTLGGAGTIATATGNTDSTLNGVTVNSGTKVTAAIGTLDLTGTITNNGEFDATSGIIDLENLILNGGTLGGAGTIATAAGNTDSTLNGVTVNSGTKVTAAVGTLDLTGTITNNGEFDATSGIIDLENLILNGGTLGGAGTIATATGNTDSTLNGVTVNSGTKVTAAIGTLDLTGTITNNGEFDATSGIIDLENLILNGGTLGGAGTIATATGNTDSTLNGVTVDSGTKVTAAIGTLDLTGTITNNGEFDATSGIIDLENLILNGGTLGGAGTIATAAGNTDSTLNGVTVNSGTKVTAAVGTLDLTGTITNNGEFDATSGIIDLENLILNGGTLGGAGTIATATGNTDSTLNGVTVNSGTKVTAAIGTLDLTGTITNNGEFDATSGIIDLENLILNGGTLGGAGTIATAAGNTDSTLNGVTVDSGTKVTAAVGTLDLTGTITNNGEFDATSGIIDLENLILNGGTLGGAGTIATAAGNTDSTLNGVTVDSGTKVTAAVGTLDLTGTITNNGEFDATSGIIDLENLILNGGTLGGAGTIATATGNTDSTLNGVTVDSGTKVTAAVGTLDLTGTITNNGEFNATSGIIDLENLILNGGTLGGAGTIATVSGANTLNSVAIAGGTTVKVTDNTVLDLKGTTANGGTIALNSSGDSTQLIISGSVLLNGIGHVTLTDNTNNIIVSDGSAATLTNFNTITGAGTIGDTLLALVNNGTIVATGTHALNIDTGINNATGFEPVGSLTVTNNSGGVLEASAGHTLQIDDNVLNNGLIEAGNPGGSSIAVVNVTGNITGTGSIEIFNNAKLEIGGSVSSGQIVTFGAQGGPVATAATLILDDSKDFHGVIAGLIENPDEDLENRVDLKDLTYRPGHMSAHFSGSAVTVSNGINSVTLNLSGGPPDPSFELAADATGGTLIDDPPASGMVTIDSGKTLDISVASTATVSFTNSNGNTGELVLDSSKDFAGQIVGFAGDGTTSNSDLINLTDVNIADVAINKTTYTDNGNDTGTLTLYNASGQALDSITFVGSYQLANFTIESDGSGHTLIVDPPVPSRTATVDGQGGNLYPSAHSGTGTTSDGVLEASAGLLKIDQSISGGGHAVIDGGSMEFVGASDALVQFSGQTAGTLYLHDVAHFTGSVTGFSYGDTINLAGVDSANVSVTNSGSLEVHYGPAASDVFSLVGNYDPSGFTVRSDSKGIGTDIVWNHQTPAIETDEFSIARNPDGTTKISGLHVSDSDPGAPNETFTIVATTDGSGSNVTIPSTGSGSLADVNAALSTGVTLNPGAAPPATEKVALTVADSFGATDTVNFIFSEQAAPNVALQGTAGKDVIFATDHQDVLTGGGGADRFVFAPTSGMATVQHTVTDFAAGLDKIDIRQFGNIGSLADLTEAQQGNDMLLTLDSHDSVLLKNVIAANLHANDFIISAHGS